MQSYSQVVIRCQVIAIFAARFVVEFTLAGCHSLLNISVVYICDFASKLRVFRELVVMVSGVL